MSRRKIPAALAEKVRQQAQFRCGYCLVGEHLIGIQAQSVDDRRYPPVVGERGMVAAQRMKSVRHSTKSK